MSARSRDGDSGAELAWLEAQLDEAARVQAALRDSAPRLHAVASRLTSALRGGARVFFFGNGGSAAGAEHWAAELSGRLYLDRPSLPAIALTTNASQLTAVANDYGFEHVFSRPLRGQAAPGDVAVAISTSGRSANVLAGLRAAREIGMITIGFTGAGGDAMESLCDHRIVVPSRDVARIQEGHEVCAHLILTLVERQLFGGI
jgi:D-sedoheptulose 7-phosphate isomerase